MEGPASERRNDWLEKESSVAYKQESDGQTGRKTIGACGPKGMPPSRRQRAASVREARLVLGKVTDARSPREGSRAHAPAQCPWLEFYAPGQITERKAGSRQRLRRITREGTWCAVGLERRNTEQFSGLRA